MGRSTSPKTDLYCTSTSIISQLNDQNFINRREMKKLKSDRVYYPFTAIVGQENIKLALLLNSINPAIGGVLIKGEKGTAKSS